MAPPINFSFLFKAYFWQYLRVVLTVIFTFQITKEVNIHNNIKKIYSNKVSKKPFFIISKFFYNNKMKIHHQLFNNQLTELSSSSKIGNIIQEREVIFKKNLTVSLPEISKLIDSTINKRQRDQRKFSFL